jgi:hypothetical protein
MPSHQHHVAAGYLLLFLIQTTTSHNETCPVQCTMITVVLCCLPCFGEYSVAFKFTAFSFLAMPIESLISFLTHLVSQLCENVFIGKKRNISLDLPFLRLRYHSGSFRWQRRFLFIIQGTRASTRGLHPVGHPPRSACWFSLYLIVLLI